jgi:putative cardiolipin synthase
MRKFLRRAAIALALLAVAWVALALASRLPADPGRVASSSAPMPDTTIGRGVAALSQAPGRSGIWGLPNPIDAFATRVLMVRAAERTLDLQYYIWNPDLAGTLLLDEVRKAADRGVRVRLLLDDDGTSGMDDYLRALDAHPNVEVRLFNPFAMRTGKMLGYLGDFSRLNRRMHNKSMTADGFASIVGGRNIGDRYFDSDPRIAFVDFDVLAIGKAPADVGREFDLFWNSEHARSAASILGPAKPGDAQQFSRSLAAVKASPEAKRYLRAVEQSAVIRSLVAGTLAFEWVPVTLIHDSPDKTAGKSTEAQLLLTQLDAILGDPKRELEVISPYFVPGETGVKKLCDISRRGVKLRIVTNSLAANDVIPVYAGFAKARVGLLSCGIALYELKPAENPAPGAPGKPPLWQRPGSSKASLHGKIFVVDRSRAFVGSFNLDPRSVMLNTEMGFVIDSPTLAGAIAREVDQRVAGAAYELRLRDDGSVEWLERVGDKIVHYDKEPATSAGRRAAAKLLAWLPIDSLL